MKSPAMRRARGYTMMEVTVALFLMALILTALVSVLGVFFTNSLVAESNRIGNELARNALYESLREPYKLELGHHDLGEKIRSGRTYRVGLDVTEMEGHEGVRLFTVTVNWKDKRGAQTARRSRGIPELKNF